MGSFSLFPLSAFKAAKAMELDLVGEAMEL